MSNKIYCGVVTHDATASAVIYVEAENPEDASIELLEAASNGAGDFEWNEGNYISEYYLCGGRCDVKEVGTINEITSKEAWLAAPLDTLVYWPENCDQPYQREAFEALADGDAEWAYMLYRHCVDSGGHYNPNTFIDESGSIENLLFGDEGNFKHLQRLLNKADLVTVDDSPMLHSWDVFEPDDGETDEDGNPCVLHFKWETREFEYEVYVSPESVEEGEWKDGRFVCKASDGSKTTITLFKLEKLS